LKDLDRSRRALHCGTAIVVLLLALPAYAHKSQAWAKNQFAAAQHLHAALEARPAQELTRADYARVINAYRRVYSEAPTSTKADPSVVAVAQLLEEMGRRFDDDDVLRAAIKQYEFLRQQYPGSTARFTALFHIGEIYKDDLGDKRRADEVFQEFLRRYPRNPFAEEARKALAEPVEKASLKSAVKPKDHAKPKASEDESDDPDADNSATAVASKAATPDEESLDKKSDAPPKSKTLAHVTGIRHWSTADSVRVAIDLEQNVKFESQRIDNPNRVFFDLFNTRLDSKVGKSYDIDSELLKKIRVSQFKPRQTRVVFEVEDASEFSASLLSNPPRLVVEIHNKLAAKKSEPKEEAAPASSKTAGRVGEVLTAGLTSDSRSDDATPESSGDDKLGMRTTVTSKGVKKTVVDADDNSSPRKATEAPDTKPASKTSSSVSDHSKNTGSRGKRKTGADVREAQPTASGDRSLIRALGLKIGKIVIDPGHGGHDTGTIGPTGLEEKELVLDVSKRLGKLLESRLGAQVIFTRSDDTFIPLETRTAIANQEGADLFVSVHANSSRDVGARGVETYYLNFTSSSEALEVAARENAVSEKSIHELQDLVKKIALKEKIEESHEFAADVERSLHGGLAARNPGIRDRGVKKAPFIVLIGANMPSILSEISFLSNPGDERRLQTGEYRQRIAESLYRGIAKYVSGLSGVKVASKIEKDQGQ
jgi:N-acetylmuramoyl-L-alanine amidase